MIKVYSCRAFCFLFFFFFSQSLIRAQNFSEVNVGVIKGSELGYSSWVDVNNDEYPDVFITGFNLNGDDFSSSLIYLNDKSGGFYNSGISNIRRVIYGSHDWQDFNNDSYADLIMSGTTSGYETDGICRMYFNNKSGGFILSSAQFPGVVSSSVLGFNYDNDGWTDVLIMGIGTDNKNTIRIYKNLQGEAFVDQTHQISVIQGGRVNLGSTDIEAKDFDNDGDDDLVIAQSAEGGFGIDVYENDRTKFVKRTSAIPALGNATFAAADFNRDGFLDLVVNGIAQGSTANTYSTSAHFHVFLGDGQMNFTLLKSFPSQGSYWGSVSAGDLDNDGLADILVNGSGNGSPKTIVYKNQGGTNFTVQQETLKGTLLGQASLGDFNFDGSLDLLVIGSLDGSASTAQARMYLNTAPKKNTKPTIPQGLTYTLDEDSILLKWQPSIDVESDSRSLSYNIRIVTKDGQLLTNALTTDNGIRLVENVGNVGLKTEFKLAFPASDFAWQVQAIDAAYYESDFSPLQEFCASPPPTVAFAEQYYCGSLVEIRAEGENIQWYEDEGLTKLVFAGSEFRQKVFESKTFFVIQKREHCASAPRKVAFTVLPVPAPVVNYNSHYCYDEQIALVAENETGMVKWFADASLQNEIAEGTHLSFRAGANPNLYVVQQLTGCESDVLAIALNVSPPLKDSIQFNGTFFSDSIRLSRCKTEEHYVLDVKTNYPHIQWEGDAEPSAMKIVAVSGEYHVTISDEYGCSTTKKLQVMIEELAAVRVANVVTGNNDGKNDALLIDPLVPGANMTILDRDGKEIFHSNSYQNTFNGAGFGTGVYYYHFQAGGCPARKGWFSLLR
jgi:hypothetical protein